MLFMLSDVDDGSPGLVANTALTQLTIGVLSLALNLGIW